MKAWVVRLVALVVLLSAAAASASQKSRQLQALGLVEFHAGRYSKALELFDQAVAADPTDVYSRYYRAVTRSRLGDTPGAISDLRAVLAAKPTMDQAALDLGVTLVQSGAYQEAIPLLVQAQRRPALDGQASLFLAVAQLRLDQIPAARQSLARAAARDADLRLSVRYYEGVADYREGDMASAEQQFAFVANASPNTDMGREAAAFLATIHQGARPVYHVFGALGLQYDSNVVLAPDNDVIKSAAGISGQADGRVTIDLGGTYSLWRAERAELLVGYEFYQSLHFQLTDFNLQDHGFNLDLNATAGWFQWGVLGRYDYYLLAAQNFLQQVVALPWVSVPEGNLGRTQLFYRMRRRDFLDQDYRVRDAFNHSAGIQQFIYLRSPDDYLLLGYRFDREDPLNARPEENANQFAYDGNEVDAGVGWLLPADVTSYVGYSYRHEVYAPPSLGRRDSDHLVTVLVSRPLTEYLTVVAAYFGTFDDSNQSSYSYNRQVGSLALEVRF